MTAPLAYVGELAGLATSAQWACSAVLWSEAGRYVSSVAVAAVRVLLATPILAVIHWAVFGTPWPTEIDSHRLTLLAVSGMIGAGLGDMFLFRALVLVGPRIATLVLSLTPILSTLIAYATLDSDSPGPQAVIGIVLTVAGVAWVVSDPRGRRNPVGQPGHFALGVAFTLVSVAAIAVGYVMSRYAMQPRDGGDGVDPFSAALVRIAAAAVFISASLPLLRRTKATVLAFGHRKAMLFMIAGTCVGPVGGMWTSMIALKGASAGVATALIHTSPVLVMIISRFAYGEKLSLRTVFGTAVAIAGVFLLFVRTA
jgi:drug/metabolite transporter (DMT)-like permease